MSFVGGGSDLPSFYRRHGGAVLSTAIDKYVYVSANPKFDGGIRLAYSQTEEVDRLDLIQHRLFRAAFEVMGIEGGVEVTTTADIPSRGTGLGSSSTFTVGLLQVMSAYLGRAVTHETLAEMACHIEIEKCGEPIGKQDQYAAAYGGLNLIVFNPDDTVEVQPVKLAEGVQEALRQRLIVFYTGVNRSASVILKAQNDAVSSQAVTRANLCRMVELAYQLRSELEAGRLESFGEILKENWALKKQLSDGISNPSIEAWHGAAIAAGAMGGKLLGAGAGGFLMFYADPENHAAIARAVGLRQVQIGFAQHGTKILFPSAL
ncbi:MAG: GHMP kinase [Proteobacteria bacterium]|nr:GHMP kinase [Pseudomonadota bacterium]